MTLLTLTRVAHFNNAVVGEFSGINLLPVYSLERGWRFNQPLLSCIPEGDYPLEPYSSEKFPSAWQVMKVPGRSSILIHPAHKVSELSGGIAPGTSYNIKPQPGNMNYTAEVTFSRAAFLTLDKWLQAAIQTGPVTLRIRGYSAALTDRKFVNVA